VHVLVPVSRVQPTSPPLRVADRGWPLNDGRSVVSYISNSFCFVTVACYGFKRNQ